MLSVSNLTKSFDREPVFSGFDLDVPENRFAVLLGPSGCGKSTLFDVLTGVEPMDEGKISWLDASLENLGRSAAYMQQKDLLLPWLTLMDNACLPAAASRSLTDRDRRQAGYLFERLGLAGYEHYRPGRVSGGMRQRCALVRTLMFNRDLILLDEPLSALDAITRRSLQSLLLLLQTEFRKTLVMITHDIEEALLLADDLYLLSPIPMTIQESFTLKSDKPRRFDDPELLEIKAHVLSRLQGDVAHEQG